MWLWEKENMHDCRNQSTSWSYNEIIREIFNDFFGWDENMLLLLGLDAAGSALKSLCTSGVSYRPHPSVSLIFDISLLLHPLSPPSSPLPSLIQEDSERYSRSSRIHTVCSPPSVFHLLMLFPFFNLVLHRLENVSEMFKMEILEDQGENQHLMLTSGWYI